MGIWNALWVGLRKVNCNKKMWFILFGIQFIFALILLLPLRSQLDKLIGHSLSGQEVLQGIGANVFFEFITHHSQTVSLEFTLLLVVGLIYLVMSIFLNGGILGIFTKENNAFSAIQFFGSAGQYFGRFLRLFLFSVVFIFIVFFIDKGFAALFTRISGDSESYQFTFRMLRILILLFLIFFINMTFDYAKIRTVFQKRRDMLRTGLRAWSFVFQNLGKTLGLYYIVVALGLLFFVLYTVLGKFISVSTSLGILLLFLWQQAYALGRIWVRLFFFSSQVTLYKNLSDQPILKAWYQDKPSRD